MNSVVLPAPFGPIRPRICALMHVEGDAVQRDDAAEHDADVANREQGISSLRELGLRHVIPPSSTVAPE